MIWVCWTVLAAPIVFPFLGMAWLRCKQQRRPIHKWEQAYLLTGDMRKAVAWQTECDAAHLPGDCLLCGAD